MNRILSCILCLLPLSALTAAPLDKTQISADAKWMLHLDLNAFQQSALGTRAIEAIRAEHGSQIIALEELIGSNLLRDINHLTLYGPDSDDKKAVLLVAGRFNSDKLLALLALNKTYQKVPFENYTLHEWVAEEHGKNQVGVFARKDLIILSQTRRPVEQALEVLDGIKPSLDQKGGMEHLPKAPELPIILAVAEDLSHHNINHAHAAILKNTDALVFSACESNQNFMMDLDLWTQQSQTAVQIEQALLGMKAFVLLNQKNQPALARLVQAFHIYSDETLISLRFQYPSEALFSILREYHILHEEIRREIMESRNQSADSKGAQS